MRVDALLHDRGSSLWQVPRIRRASTSSSTLEQQPPKKTSRRDYSDFAFVTFFALGDQGDSGHKCATSLNPRRHSELSCSRRVMPCRHLQADLRRNAHVCASLCPPMASRRACRTPPTSAAVLRRRGFQFTSLDTKYARVLKKSHPGSRLALLTDMDTQFNFNGVDDIEVRP